MVIYSGLRCTVVLVEGMLKGFKVRFSGMIPGTYILFFVPKNEPMETIVYTIRLLYHRPLGSYNNASTKGDSSLVNSFFLFVLFSLLSSLDVRTL